MAEVAHRVSVVIPLYNKEKYIRRAIASVLSQTFRDFELIIVNDGSTDNGPAIVRKFTDSRIHLVDQENQGASGARNRGIEESRGELIAFLDADDEWLSDHLDTIVALAGRFPDAGAYSTGWRWLRKNGRYFYQDVAVRSPSDQCASYFDLVHQGGAISTSSIAIRRSVFRTLSAFRVGQHLHQDMDMWFRIALHYDFAYSPKVCSLYHSYIPDNATHRVTYGEYSPLYLSLQDLRNDASVAPCVRVKAERYMAYHLIWLVKIILLRGTPKMARLRLRDYRNAFGITPAYIKFALLSSIPAVILRPAVILGSKLILLILFVRNLVATRVKLREITKESAPAHSLDGP